jgi:hypothetical protein
VDRHCRGLIARDCDSKYGLVVGRMSWLIKLLAKAKGIDMSDVMNQQMSDEIIRALKDVLL